MGGRDNPLRLERLEELGVRSFVTLVLIVVGLLLSLVIVAVLPGIDREVPGLPITVAAIISLVVTLALVVSLLLLSGRANTVVRQFQVTVPEVAAQSAAVVYWTIVFLAAVIAHQGFGSALAPVLTETGLLWAYDVTFFVLGGVPLISVGYHLFRLLDPLAEFCVSRLRSGMGSESQRDQSTLASNTVSDEDAT